MTTAAVVYCSRTGRTQRYAEEIGAYLSSKGIETAVSSVADADPAAVAGADLVLLGSWTSGLMLILQHPDGPWASFVRELPRLGGRVALFTTYKLLTGTVFARMREMLAGKAAGVALDLKSRDGHLGEADRRAIDAFVSAGPA